MTSRRRHLRPTRPEERVLMAHLPMTPEDRHGFAGGEVVISAAQYADMCKGSPPWGCESFSFEVDTPHGITHVHSGVHPMFLDSGAVRFVLDEQTWRSAYRKEPLPPPQADETP